MSEVFAPVQVVISRQMFEDSRYPRVYLQDLVPAMPTTFEPITYVNLDAMLPPNPNIEREERQRFQRRRQQEWIDQHCLCRYEAEIHYGEVWDHVRVDGEACPVHGRNPDYDPEDDL